MPDSIHFIGAGGVGVSGLAHLALDLGHSVSASDTASSRMLETLRARGVDCTVGHRTALPDGTGSVVYSAAVPENDPERLLARAQGIPEFRRGAWLNMLATRFGCRIAVSGSHGKTTTSAMLTHILRTAGRNPGFLIGGSVNGWERAAAAGDGTILVSEVDESDGSQAGFPASISLVLNIDDDHSWALGGTEALEACFLSLCRPAQTVICWRSPVTERLFGGNGNAVFLDEPLPLPELAGWHNRVNAAMAVEAAVLCGVPRGAAREALRSFPGVSRRLSVRAQTGGRVLIEDYAHHPSELAATLDALREKYPGKPLMVVFQPHRNERVLRYGEAFGKLLSRVDWVGLTDAFGAWRTDGQFVDVRHAIGDHIAQGYSYLAGNNEACARRIWEEWARRPDAVLALVGAGDITQLVPCLQNFTD